MAIGPAIRSLFGRHEHRAAEAFRGLFMDMDDLVSEICAGRPEAARILEIGCGEGAMTERLVRSYPGAELLAIDITPRLGRLYRGDPARVVFRQVSVETVALERPGGFDLVLLCEVLNHVPPAIRRSLLDSVRTTLAPGGVFVLKEWAPSRGPVHWLCAASDRYLTGDEVAYLCPSEAEPLLAACFGTMAVRRGRRSIAPNPNNYLFLVSAPLAP